LALDVPVGKRYAPNVNKLPRNECTDFHTTEKVELKSADIVGKDVVDGYEVTKGERDGIPNVGRLVGIVVRSDGGNDGE
jgi:hypothetical protein